MLRTTRTGPVIINGLGGPPSLVCCRGGDDQARTACMVAAVSGSMVVVILRGTAKATGLVVWDRGGLTKRKDAVLG